MTRWRPMGWIAIFAATALLGAACGLNREDEGAGGATSEGLTETEIKIGGSYPFSGPASAYRAIADGANARFAAVNAEGGIDGRKIKFIALDDAYEPPKAVSNARRLIEQERVFALFNTLGTPNNLAIWEYANEREVPHVYVATGASDFGNDLKGHPWTSGWQPNYVTEARVYAEFLKKEKPKAKVAVLYQNDGFGKDLLSGFEEALSGSDVEVVAQESYEVTAPTVAAEVKQLAASDADTFLNVTTPKFSAQAIAAVAASEWKPLHILNNVGSSKSLVLKPVGLRNAKGIVSTAYHKDPEDPQWDDDEAMKEFKAALKKYKPRANPDELFNTYGWAAASTLVQALENMRVPTRQGFMDSVRNMNEEIPIMLPGNTVETGPGDGFPIEAMRIMRFDGENWQLEGELIEAKGR